MKKVLTPRKGYDIIIKSRARATGSAAVAQSVERRIGSAEVTGPIPVSSFSNFLISLGLRDFIESKPINEPIKANLVGFYFAWNSGMLLMIWLLASMLRLFLW